MSPALIFDLDGTLVDTAPDLLGALNAILQQEGRPPVNHADLRHLVGFGARAMMIEAFKMTGGPMDDARLPALIGGFIAHYRKHIAVASRPFPGVESTLAALKADGARMGVLTNKPQELTDLLVARRESRFLFQRDPRRRPITAITSPMHASFITSSRNWAAVPR